MKLTDLNEKQLEIASDITAELAQRLHGQQWDDAIQILGAVTGFVAFFIRGAVPNREERQLYMDATLAIFEQAHDASDEELDHAPVTKGTA